MTLTAKEIFFKHVLNNKCLWFIALSNAFVYMVRYGCLDWAPTILTEKGIDLKSAGWAYFAYEFAAIPGTLLCGWMSDKLFKGRRAPPTILFMTLVALSNETYSAGVSLPTSDDYKKTLVFEGSATRNTSSVGGANVIDMMCRVTAMDDDLDASIVGSDAILAFAIDTDHYLQVYCKDSPTATAGFRKVGTTTYEENSWIRITFLVDYKAKTFQLAINGAYADGTFYLAKDTSAMSSVSAIGSSSIDDFVVKSEANPLAYDAKYAQVDSSGATPADTTVKVEDITVPVQYLRDNGLTTEGATPAVAKAYQAGIAPSETFAFTAAEMTDSSVTLTFPGSWPAASYTVKYGSDLGSLKPAKQDAALKEGGANKVTLPFDFGESNHLYYTVTR